MESSPNQDDPGAQPQPQPDAAQTRAIAAILRQIQADEAAGKKSDFTAIIQAYPQLAPKLAQELESLQRTHKTRTQSSQHTTTFISDEMRAAAKPTIEISGYSMISEIGRGGQAVVYLAIQLSTGRKRALKVLRDGRLADSQATARFGREIATLASLHHPNIVPIIDTGETADGHRYMVMDYIAGSSLDEFLKGRHGRDADDPSRLLKMFLKICAAVNIAHRSGIIHRDLKPSNILIDERGEPHILDFGLARTALDRFMRPDTGQVSVTGEFLGSLPWSSPEQAEGDPDRIDIRTDVYSLGVILYQILTGGKFPYEVVGNIRDVLNNILTAQPTPPTKVVAAARARESRVVRQAAPPQPPIVNDAIEGIVLKALAKKPEARYQTAGELGRDISNYLHGQPTARATEQPPPATSRSGALKYAVLCTSVLIAAAAIVFAVRRNAPPPALVVQTQPQLQAQSQPATQMIAAPVLASAPLSIVTPPAAPARNFPMQAIANGAAHLEGADLALTPRGQGACSFFIGTTAWSNYQLTFKAIANSEEGFAVWVHWTALGNFMAVTPTNPLPDLWVRQNGQFERLRVRRGRIEPDRWHDIRVTVRGAEVHFDIDGEEWFQAADDRCTHGRIALVSRNAAARFRDIRVTAPDGTILYAGPPDLADLPPLDRDSLNLRLIPALKRIDLLKTVDPVKNALSGAWNLKNGVLSNAAGAKAQIEFPYTAPQEYDYRVTLQRTRGTEPISLICTGGGHEFSWVLGGPNNTITGLAMVGGQNFDSNPSTATRMRPLILAGQSHLLVVVVRKEMIRAFIDGVQHCILKTDLKNLSLDPALKSPAPNSLGLCLSGDSVQVTAADVLEVVGEPQTSP